MMCCTANGDHFPLKVRSMVGLIPLFAVETFETGDRKRMPSFRRRLEWFVQNRLILPNTWPA